MKVKLFKNPHTYSCYSYYIRGDWNAISDVNTLIDVGTNDYIVNEIMQMSGGVGKSRVEKVILTHEHFDHTGGLKHVIKEWNPEVFSFKQIPGVTHKLLDGDILKIGDREAQILHTPGHSQDSICVYIPKEKTIFVGDTAYNIKTPGGSYSIDFVMALERLAELELKILYSGHDDPIFGDVNKIIQNTLKNIYKSKIIK